MHGEIPSSHGGPRRSLPWRGLLKLGVSAALLVALFYQTDPSALWAQARSASPLWIGAALGLYLLMILVSAWRWGQLLTAQGVHVSGWVLTQSYLVATFFNNFLPSNIGGDVVRIRDTSKPMGSKTLAATVVLVDRAIGLIGLLVVASAGATLLGHGAPGGVLVWPPLLWLASVASLAGLTAVVVAPGGLCLFLRPLRLVNAEWVDLRLQRLSDTLSRFRRHPVALVNCFGGAVAVQAVLVLFYLAVATSLAIPISAGHLAVLVPLSFVIQMVPVSLNGFGVREATFTYYFGMLGLSIESALLLSLVGTAVIMVFSLSGAATYVVRRHPAAASLA